MIDSHIHVVDFLQRGPAGADLIAAMKGAGVDRAVVFGMSVKKTWPEFEPKKPGYYLDDNAPCIYYSLTDQLVAELVVDLPPEDQRRLAPLVCGIDPTDRLAVEDIERMWKKYPFWRGVGELLLRHDDLTNLTYGEPARINHPALDDVFQFCREHDCPVSVHQDLSAPGRPRDREYMVELTEALDRHPHTTAVWCHVGADRRLDPYRYTEVVEELTNRYDKLHFDLSWVLLDRAVCPDGEPDPEWIDVLDRHPERFVLGTDTTGDLDGFEESVRRFDPLLAALEPQTRDLLAHGNAERLWFAG